MMPKEEPEKKAFDLFDGGFCCSEAISRTIVDRFAEHPEGYPVRVASGFCGGLGRSHEDVCGALTGGVLAAGYLLGRTEPGGDIGEASRVISEFRRRFLETFGSTNCAVLLQRLGEQEKGIQCKRMTAQAAGMLSDILEKTIGRREG